MFLKAHKANTKRLVLFIICIKSISWISYCVKCLLTVFIYPNHLSLLLQSPHFTNEEPLNSGENIYWDIQMDSLSPCLSPSLEKWGSGWRDVTEIGCDSTKMRLTNILMRKCHLCSLVPTTPDYWPWERGGTQTAAKAHQMTDLQLKDQHDKMLTSR